VSAEAAKEGSGATEHAFPIDLSVTMRLTGSRASTHFFENAVLAQHVFSLLLLGHLLLTVNKSTEVGHLAPVTFVERTSVHSVLLWLVVVEVAFGRESFVMQNALVLGVE